MMKISERDKLMLTIIAIVVIGVFFFMYLLPPTLDNMKALQNKEGYLDEEIAAVRESMNKGDDLQSEFKALNIKALAFSNKFYPEMAQEKIILDLNKLLEESGLNVHNISFSEEQNNASKIKALRDKSFKQQSLNDLPKMTVSINYNGTFNQLLTFLDKVGEFDQKIIIDKADIINTSQKGGINSLAGNMSLEFYAVPCLLKVASGVSFEDFTGIIGGHDPFSGLSLVDADVIDILMGRTKTDICDFVLTAKPITSDLPTVVLGLDDDVSAESFVCADNPGVENAELHLFMRDGLYYCQYNTEQQSYPHHDDGVKIPYLSGDREIVLKIFSNPRTSASDLSGVNLSLYNETDRALVVKLINDDPERPRVKIIEQVGFIEFE